MKILFIGGGRRTSLAERFIRHEIIPIGYEIEDFTPLNSICEVVPGLSWNNPNILSHLSDVMSKYKCNVLLPLQDKAVELIAKAGYNICSSEYGAYICNDKQQFNTFMSTEFPAFYPSYNGNFPIIAKPRFGFSSKGIITINNQQEFEKINLNDYVLQSKKNGTEYSVDAYFNRYFEFVGAVPRIRIRVAGGEVVDSITKFYASLRNIIEIVGKKLHLRGPICAQFIVEPDGKAWLFEINARFGGGCTLSCEAGFDIIKMIKDEYYFDKDVSIEPYWRENVLLRRSYIDHFKENITNV